MSYARQLLDTYQGTVTADASVLAAATSTARLTPSRPTTTPLSTEVARKPAELPISSTPSASMGSRRSARMAGQTAPSMPSGRPNMMNMVIAAAATPGLLSPGRAGPVSARTPAIPE